MSPPTSPPPATRRLATTSDLPTLIDLLRDDPLGTKRESAAPDLFPRYRQAFDAIDQDPNHELWVAEADGRVVGLLQLSFLPHLTYGGRWRAQIEGVRVAATRRSMGIGRTLFTGAIERARERGCHMVQLTTDRRRPGALRFYESLGFQATHDGMKLHLDGANAEAATTRPADS